MNKYSIAALVLFLPTGFLFAADPAVAQFLGNSVLAAGLGVGIAAGGCGVGMGLCIASELQGIARQPEITPKLQLNMMIGLAFIESLVLYTLFIAILLLFANPLMKTLVH